MPLTSIAEFLDPANNHTPTTAERSLIAAVRAGRACILNGGTRPTDASDATHVRADLLRLLIVGGTTDCGLHGSGVVLIGGYITGTLDLRFAKARGQCVLNACHFVEEPNLTQARLALLSLDGSQLPGLFAPGIKTTGSVQLRTITATGTVHLSSAQIGGQLACTGAMLNGASGKALSAQGIITGKDLLLSNVTATGTVHLSSAQIGGQLTCIGATLNGAGAKALSAQGIITGKDLLLSNLTAIGTIDVNSAQIGGQLTCIGATLNGAGGYALSAQRVTTGESLFLRNLITTGTVDVAGARIGGQLDCTGAKLDGAGDQALNAARLHVAEGFTWREVKSVIGTVNLFVAHVGDLIDDANSWNAVTGTIVLDGFTYENIGPDSARTESTRRDFLLRGSTAYGTFSPQPYTIFAKFLRNPGNTLEARRVLMQRERQMFAAEDVVNLAALNHAHFPDILGVVRAWLRYYGLRVWAGFTGRVSGYGHAPQYALFWSVALIAGGALVYTAAWRYGLMVPNSAVILTSADWLKAVAQDPVAPALIWSQDPALLSPPHYETFYSAIYALDVFVPLVNLGQESAWSATTVTGWGVALRWATVGFQIAGWAITALGIAAITGFVQKNQPD